MNGYIYQLKCKVTNKSYIGQSINVKKRIWKHKSIAKTNNYNKENNFYNDINSYGIETFELIILEVCDVSLLDIRERYWIQKLNTIEPNGYNILLGGHKLFKNENPFYGKHHTDETKNKISNKNKNRKISKEEREMRQRINSKENNPFYGKHHTDETKNKIKQTNTMNGNYEKMSKRMKENNPNKNGKYSKKIKCVMIDPISKKELKQFESLTEAAEYCKKLNLTKSKSASCNISIACKNSSKSYGYYWKFL